jgi:hypothetical protein
MPSEINILNKPKNNMSNKISFSPIWDNIHLIEYVLLESHDITSSTTSTFPIQDNLVNNNNNSSSICTNVNLSET